MKYGIPDDVGDLGIPAKATPKPNVIKKVVEVKSPKVEPKKSKKGK